SCGLGWKVTDKKSFLGTTTRGSTNGFVPPSFGMSSGTLGCEVHSFAKNDAPAVEYAVANYETLSIEMAQGRGEFLVGFARTLGCSDATTGAFEQMTQEKYDAVVGASATEMFQNVKHEIGQNPVLSAGCGV